MSHYRLLTRRWQWMLGLTLAFVVSVWAAQPLAAQAGWPATQPLDPAALPPAMRDGAGTYYIPGQVLLARRVDGDQQPRWLADQGWRVIAPLEVRGVQAAMSRMEPGLEPDVVIVGEVLAVPVGGEWGAIAALQADPAVIYAEPNWIVTAADAEPETPLHISDSLYLERQWYLQRINASRAWQLAGEHGDMGVSVRVAIVDSGVERTHPEFGDRVSPVRSFVSDGSLDDDCGHGTYIAGLVGAAMDNGPGIAGLAPAVRIDPYRALSYSTTTQGCTGSVDAVAAAIYAAVDSGADIINMSLTMPAIDNTLFAAIDDAHDKGVLLVAAAGNCDFSNPGCPVMYPAAFDEVIGVGATGYFNELAPYNTRGDRIEFSAPGGTTLSQLYSTWSDAAAPLCTNGYQVINGGGYCNSMGTSAAAGLVTGAAALIWGMDSDLSADQVRQILRDTVTPYDSPQPGTGAGLLNASVAVHKVLPPILELSADRLGFTRAPGAAAFEAGLRLDNPSGTLMNWQLTLLGDQDWLSFTGLDTSSVSGSVAFGQPAQVSLTISPTDLVTGVYSTVIEAVGSYAGDQQVHHGPVQLAVYEDEISLYMPVVVSEGNPDSPWRTPFQWAQPDANGRAVRNVSDNSTATAHLPFAFPMGDEAYDSLRIYADGFVSLPDDDRGTVDLNRCPPSALWPDQAIYGWWADLNPKASGAQVSTFSTDDGAYVIEYLDVPARVGGVETYRVSFQIALKSDGEIRLNYLNAPETLGDGPRATVGIEARDGRLYNLIYCADNSVEYGETPKPRQSIIIQPEGAF